MDSPLHIPANSFIKVINDTPVGTPFSLPDNYLTDAGTTILSVALLTAEEKRNAGLWPVVETLPTYDEHYQALTPVYTLGETSVSLTYTVETRMLAALTATRIAEAYELAKRIIDKEGEGYSVAEVATFPLVQAEVLAYNADSNVVGPRMQAIISRGRHTAATLSALLTPKINTQVAALSNRDNHVATLSALTTAADVGEYDVTTGWPV